MEDCVTKGVRAGVIITAGFAETGAAGKQLQDEVVRIARRGGIRFVGPNCMGYWSASSNLGAFMFPLPVRDGPLALVSQGGNVGGAVVVSGYQRGLGFHRYVSCGCAADIQIEDYIEHFGSDPAVKVILAYIEGLEDGRRFVDKVRGVTTKKPVIALKPGRTAVAVRAIKSHSGAMAGSDAVHDAAFEKAGVIRVESAEELLDVALGFLTQPLPRGRNVAIITPGGSYGVLCAEACASEGLNVIELPDETIAALDKVFPPRWSRGNPVDPAGDRNFIAYLTAPGKLLRLDEVDSLIFMGFGGFSGFASMVSAQASTFAGPFQPLLSSARRFEELAPALAPVLGSGRVSEITKVVRPAVSMLASALGVEDEEEVDEFTQLVSSAIAAGRFDTSRLSRPPRPPASTSGGGMGAPRRGTLADAIDYFLGGLMRHLVETYDKPIITTTFTEELSRLRGGHYSYPSGQRATRVLTKLVEYEEYLRREGVHREQTLVD